jgi:hypothetical protein
MEIDYPFCRGQVYPFDGMKIAILLKRDARAEGDLLHLLIPHIKLFP